MRNRFCIVLAVFCAYLFSQVFYDSLWKLRSYTSLDEVYFTKSNEVLHKFDHIRRYDLDIGNPKLASNSYIDNVTVLHKGPPLSGPKFTRENATLLMLCRNWELNGVLKSMRSLEDKFNRNYNYDWVFLNDVPFDQEFMEQTSAMASGETYYGLIPEEDWNVPDWIDKHKFQNALIMMDQQGVLYGGSRSYRNMCRFNSGFFFRQKLLQNYDYYFRVEPHVEYFCDFPYDPFKFMRERNKKYGFVITLFEYEDTVPTLWETVEEFIALYPELVDFKTNAYQFISQSTELNERELTTSPATDYNLCHFWTNFEIGDLNFFRSERYLKFFEYLDQKGGFYYERWGDAPVHSIAVALLMKTDEIHHFDDIGYYHAPYGTCPRSHGARLAQRCVCDTEPSKQNIDLQPFSCLPLWWKNGGGKYFMG
ncbi:mannosyltransferase YUR1 Ecym_5194 [Eremothecium cymbalariae DBVPG|uniref:Glycosyltransferase family 15 protein n=1 Tax=Eremothecium cymbalariae (strain CBS 270.75 / DBVPG 7215 / KCTC 17166 / NRRL Y-17582) TaxID=931890 RepID=I6ND23_ERECY|nr:hypothetical protein Ecym_5194 [Eremothecium cymbalariae DBVPG\